MNVQEMVDSAAALFAKKKIESARLSAELIVAHVTQLDRTRVLANPIRSLSPAQERNYHNLVERRAKSEPIPYLTGHVEFYSHTFKIMKGVFIPRPETETLVDGALEAAKESDMPKILDVGIGCGNIVIAMAHSLRRGEFHGTDISNKAIQCAQQNVREHNLGHIVTLHEGNMFEALSSCVVNKFDVIVSNPPYIKTGDIPHLPHEIKNFEPHVSLDGGPDGLNYYRSFMDNVASLLSPGGAVCLEIDPTLTQPVSELVEREKVFTRPEVTKDYSGKDRVLSFAVKH